MVSASIHKGVCGAHVCMMRTTLLSGLAMCTTPIHQAAVVLLRPGEDHTLAHGLQHALATLSLASAIARILRYVALSSGLPTAAIVRSFSLRHQARAASPSISSSHRCGSAFTSRCAADTGRLDGSSEAPEKPARLHAARRRRGRRAENIDASSTRRAVLPLFRPWPCSCQDKASHVSS
jgi:hypothetical protein